MKKLLLLMCAIMTLIGCEKEGAGLDTRLVGTKWQTKDPAYALIHGGTCYEVYEFINATEVEAYTTKNGSIVNMYGTFKYELNYPNITIHRAWSDGDVSALKFVFRDSRTMVRDGEDVNEYASYMKYIRQ